MDIIIMICFIFGGFAVLIFTGDDDEYKGGKK